MLEFIVHRFLLALLCRGGTLSLAVLAGSALLPVTSSAYLIDGTKWLRGEAEFYVAVPGLSASEISWNSAVIDALNNWSTNTLFNFTVVEEYKDPCVVDGFSSIDFSGLEVSGFESSGLEFDGIHLSRLQFTGLEFSELEFNRLEVRDSRSADFILIPGHFWQLI